MELLEPVKHLELAVLTNCLVYLCGDHVTVFGELEPLDELAELRDDWDDLVVRDCIEGLVECSEYEVFIISLKLPELAFPCPEPLFFLPECCDNWSDHAIAIQSSPLKSESVNSGSCSLHVNIPT